MVCPKWAGGGGDYWTYPQDVMFWYNTRTRGKPPTGT